MLQTSVFTIIISPVYDNAWQTNRLWACMKLFPYYESVWSLYKYEYLLEYGFYFIFIFLAWKPQQQQQHIAELNIYI